MIAHAHTSISMVLIANFSNEFLIIDFWYNYNEVYESLFHTSEKEVNSKCKNSKKLFKKNRGNHDERRNS